MMRRRTTLLWGILIRRGGRQRGWGGGSYTQKAPPAGPFNINYKTVIMVIIIIRMNWSHGVLVPLFLLPLLLLLLLSSHGVINNAWPEWRKKERHSEKESPWLGRIEERKLIRGSIRMLAPFLPVLCPSGATLLPAVSSECPPDDGGGDEEMNPIN